MERDRDCVRWVERRRSLARRHGALLLHAVARHRCPGRCEFLPGTGDRLTARLDIARRATCRPDDWRACRVIAWLLAGCTPRLRHRHGGRCFPMKAGIWDNNSTQSSQRGTKIRKDILCAIRPLYKPKALNKSPWWPSRTFPNFVLEHFDPHAGSAFPDEGQIASACPHGLLQHHL